MCGTMDLMPSPDERALSSEERAMTHAIFGESIDMDKVRIRRRKWWLFQPKGIVMAPRGHIHFHPASETFCTCFGASDPSGQGLFIHEMTHVWQHQSGLNLLLRRHPFCRYGYVFKPGKPFNRYGIEQQAEIVRHVFLMRQGWPVENAPPLAMLEAILPFGPGAGAESRSP
jgi:hypothetical protein